MFLVGTSLYFPRLLFNALLLTKMLLTISDASKNARLVERGQERKSSTML